MRDDLLATPEELLALATQHDLDRARDVIAGIAAPRLLEVLLGQGLLAVEPGRVRMAGIDAVAELERAAVELMGMSQGIHDPANGSRGAFAASTDDEPVLTGWELTSVDTPDELVGATSSLHVRPWHLALIAFSDAPCRGPAGRPAVRRSLTAATADGRLVTATLRMSDADAADAPEILDACVTAHLEDLTARAALAWGLRAVLGAPVPAC
jgi:hypothetical protein